MTLKSTAKSSMLGVTDKVLPFVLIGGAVLAAAFGFGIVGSVCGASLGTLIAVLDVTGMGNTRTGVSGK